MGLVGVIVILLDKMIKHLVSDYKMAQTGKICFLVTCPQIGSILVRPGIGLKVKFWT